MISRGKSYYLYRAEEMRIIAESQRDPFSRLLLMRVVEDYEKMALQAEEMDAQETAIGSRSAA